MQRIETLGGLEDAACRQADATGKAVLAKGGHLASDRLTDVLARARRRVTRWESERIDTRHTHGTGCTLASAIACGLASGLSLTEAIEPRPRLRPARDPCRARLRRRPRADGPRPGRRAVRRYPQENMRRFQLSLE